MPASTRGTSRSSTRMTADERREAIVAAGMDEFAVGGMVGASTDVIAKRAGVSQPYVFQLFGTKRDLFLAVVRRGFERTRLAFEQAARDFQPGADPACDTILMALGASYKRLLRDRTLLLVQLQAYAACSDPTVRDVVRQEFETLHRSVRELSGADAHDLYAFFAEGMLLNIAAAVEIGGPHRPIAAATRSWLLEHLEGEA